MHPSSYTLLNYNQQRPFSSFLPGVAGQLGVPMWVFYVNRGQAVASFGIESKDSPIMEFQPANKAYQRTATEGFRTFIKWKKGAETGYYEPFSSSEQANMSISMSELTLTDENISLGLKTAITYFTLPNESFAALARQVTLTNTDDIPLELEILDGMPALIPYGVDNGGLKHIGRTLEAWMQVFHRDTGLPFFRLAATSGDTADVQEIQAGYFALGFSERGANTPIVDPVIVFGENTSLNLPDAFLVQSIADLQERKQITVGKTPCAFFAHTLTIEPSKSVTLYALFGHINGYENIASEHQRIATPAYFAQKRAENQALIQNLTSTVATHTADPRFDAYVRQTYLDNILRGGKPIFLGGRPYHIYSRKHGDPERDYNHFFLAAEFYSQGNGNFRDVCQNRRSDVLLDPRLGDHNVRTFLSLIQLDGYNPLVIRGTSFHLDPKERTELLTLVSNIDLGLVTLLEQNFTPGSLLKHIVDHRIELTVPHDEFIEHALQHAKPHLDADYGEGFWVDHWTYILDLIENFIAVYPDRKDELLAVRIPFYRSPAKVRPRAERYTLTKKGVRQYNAVAHVGEAGWEHTADGERYRTTILGKLLILVGTKFGTLDPEGMGIEMEAGKPGWYDALNGLPGLFGSSMNETYELLRLIRFLQGSLIGKEYVALPVEFGRYFRDLATLSKSGSSRIAFWEQANNLRESYRAEIYQHSVSGEEVSIPYAEIDETLQSFTGRLEDGIARAKDATYFRYEMTEYDTVAEEIHAKAFCATALPPFLEGAVRSLKVADTEQAKEIYKTVRQSALFDEKLKMYKVNAPLGNEPHEIGRARAFTSGWLENESIWLHMEYKYLLEILKAGLYDEFFAGFKDALIPFQRPDRYGRSPLENSSFLVSSAHPDESLHGNGFVARLSGATAEFVEMWTIMMAGKQPFMMQDGELVLSFRPVLPAWIFSEENRVQFNFLGSIPVIYQNLRRVDTWDALPRKITLHMIDGQYVDFEGPDIPMPYAEMVRECNLKSIHISL